jgi:hypothetical protein
MNHVRLLLREVAGWHESQGRTTDMQCMNIIFYHFVCRWLHCFILRHLVNRSYFTRMPTSGKSIIYH